MTGAGPGRGPHPVATYRIQVTPDHDLDAVAAEVDDLAGLGISHLYLSPVFEAAPGSTHGYDVTDPTQVRAALGGDPAFDRLVTAVRAAGLGLVVDIVPNHMATATPENPWWWSLLAEGVDGPARGIFDVKGEPVVLPVLGAPLLDELEAGTLVVEQGGDGRWVARYHELVLPIRPDDPDPSGPPAEVLARQHHLPTFWRDGGNYRRFFDIDDLVGVRVEDPEVFDRTHALVADWCRAGTVDGLRVDHVDGLADPEGYLQRLAATCPDAWLLVEKILEHDEALPGSWPVAGTTGYEAAVLLDQVSVDPAGEAAMTATYQELTGDRSTWAETVAEAKAEVLDTLFARELHGLATLGAAATGRDAGAVRPALRALVLGLDRYRTYVPLEGSASDEDRAVLGAAAEQARAGGVDDDVLGALLPHLLGDRGERELAARFQQLTGPVMAKGSEDTASYRYLRMVALNEVGGHPGRIGIELDDFHAWALDATAWPYRLLAGTTHDTKRSESVRSRLTVLSQVPERWREAVDRWQSRLPFDDPAAGYLVWQTMVGAWPIGPDRLWPYLEKATREAKRHTSWLDPDEQYEKSLQDTLASLFDDEDLVADLEAFVDEVAPAGRTVDLGHLLLRCTLPGVPDLYQGSEDELLSLVDPDNRRPVDPALHRASTPRSEVIQAALTARREHPGAFGPDGSYEPLDLGDDVVAFLRGGQVATIVPRFPLSGRPEVNGVELPGAWDDRLVGQPVRLLIAR